LKKGGITVINKLKRLHAEDSGQDLIEYALIGLIIALGAIAGMTNVAASVNKEFNKIAAQLT
jgi:Flp pilus assembly pilin Flp